MQTSFQFQTYAGMPSSTEWSQAGVVKGRHGENGAYFVSLRVREETELLDIAMIGLALTEEISTKIKEVETTKLSEWIDLVESMTKGVGEEVGVTLGVVMLVGNKVLIVGVGEIEANLLRQGRKDTLLRRGKATGVRGELQKGDRVQIATWRADIEAPENSSNSGEARVILEEEAGPLTIDSGSTLYVGGKKRSKIFAYVGYALLGTLFLIVIFGAWRRSVITKEQQYARVRTEITNAMNEAKQVVQLEPEKAKKILVDVRGGLLVYKTQAKGKYLARADELIRSLDEAETAVLKRSEASLSTWIELGLLSLDKTPQQLIVDQDDILHFETTNGLVGLSLADKSQLPLVVEGYPIVNDLVIEGDELYVLANDGVYGGELGKKISLKKLIEPDEAWQKPSRIMGFGGSLYVLDTGSGEISKYGKSEGKLLPRKRWLGKGIVLDLSKIVDMVVDGDLWLLSSSGKLERYSRGAPVDFTMEGYANEQGEKRFDNPVAVATTENEVFVLEKGKGRVVVFEKSGKYSRQYLNEGFKEGRDLVVWEDKGYVLREKEIGVFGL